MSSSTTAVPDAADGQVLTSIHKRIRTLRKKLNRLTRLEGNSVAKMNELLKLRQPISSALSAIYELEKLRKEISLAFNTHVSVAAKPNADVNKPEADVIKTKFADNNNNNNENDDKKDDGKRDIEETFRIEQKLAMSYIGMLENGETFDADTGRLFSSFDLVLGKQY